MPPDAGSQAVDDGATAAQAAAEELSRLRQIAEDFAPLADVAERIKNDPSKIFDVRAALEGKLPATAPAEARPQAQQQVQLTPEQRAAINAKIMEDPFGAVSLIADQIANERFNGFLAGAQPVLDVTADNYLENYKNRKAVSDKLFGQTLPYFDREIKDIAGSGLLGMTATDRTRALDLRWQAAQAQMFQGAIAKNPPKDQAQNLGSGGGGGGGSQGAAKPSVFERNTDLQRLVAAARDKDGALVSEDDLKDIIAEMAKERDEDY